jgi:hypothetical protein
VASFAVKQNARAYYFKGTKRIIATFGADKGKAFVYLLPTHNAKQGISVNIVALGFFAVVKNQRGAYVQLYPKPRQRQQLAIGKGYFNAAFITLKRL